MIQLITHDKHIDKFLKDLVKQTKKHNVDLRISFDNYVQFGQGKSNGFFDSDGKDNNILACSFGVSQEKWLRTLVHESCHFDQWRLDCKQWNDLKVGKSDACTMLFNWIENLNIKRSKQTIQKYTDIVRNLELDCERRVVKKIKKYNLPINIESYCQNAGAYVTFYNYIKETRKWYKIGKEPYNNKKIIKLMPKNLKGNYTELTDKLRTLFKECV